MINIFVTDEMKELCKMSEKLIKKKIGYMPEYQTEGSSCFDARACISSPVVLLQSETMTIPLGIHLDIPEGYEAKIRPRSSTSKKGILVHEGTIDSDYTGEIKFTVSNLTDRSFYIMPLQRIVQVAIQKVEKCQLKEIKSLEKFKKTKRGGEGFGHTGEY